MIVTRTVVHLHQMDGPAAPLNLNDYIGLPAHCDYRIEEYLYDVTHYDGLAILARDGDTVTFSDGRTVRLEERMEPIDPKRVDPATMRGMRRYYRQETTDLTKGAVHLKAL